MYAVKEAVIAKDHVPGLATTIFYMDMRTHGKDFDKYLERARDESNVRFVRCRVNGVEPQGPTATCASITSTRRGARSRSITTWSSSRSGCRRRSTSSIWPRPPVFS